MVGQCRKQCRKMGRTIGVVAVAAGLLLGGVGAPQAQAAEKPNDLSFGSGTTPPAVLSDLFVTLAFESLIGTNAPTADQLTRARILLDTALKLSPEDAELWLMRRELASRMQDPAAASEALRRYCTLVPADDSAQFELVLDNASSLQTIDQRVAIVERLLDGPNASRLSAPLRSRLATYAAAQLRESSDPARMTARLKQALSLDPSNADAARLLYEWVVARNAGVAERGVAMLAIVKAAPVDSNARWGLGNALLSLGAYDAAAQQFMASSAVSSGREEIEDIAGHYTPWAVALLGAGRFDDATQLMNELESGFINVALNLEKDRKKKAEDAPDTGEAPQAAVTPDIPIDLEFCNYIIRDRNNQKDRAEGAYTRLRTRLTAGARDDDPAAIASLVWCCLIANRDLTLAETSLAKITEQKEAGFQRLRGWFELRKGRNAAARELFLPLASQDSFAAYGLALLEAPAERAAALQLVIDRFPASLAGAMSARDLVDMKIQPKASPQAIAITRPLDAWPQSVRVPDTTSNPWTMMTLTVDPDHYGYLEPIYATVAVRNMTDQPLSLGDGGAVSRQVLIAAAPRRAGDAMPEPSPVVVDISRKLRIEPRQSVQVRARIDRTGLGTMLVSSPTETVTFNLTAVLDPVPSRASGGVVPGPLGAVTTTNMILREGMQMTNPNLDLWTRWVGPAGDPVDRMRAVAIFAQTATRLGDAADAKKIEVGMVDAITSGYEGFDEITQAWTLAFLPRDPDGLSLFKSVHEQAQRSKSRLVQLTYMTVHIHDAESPILTAAMRSEDKDLSAYANATAVTIRAAEEAAANQPSPTGP